MHLPSPLPARADLRDITSEGVGKAFPLDSPDETILMEQALYQELHESVTDPHENLGVLTSTVLLAKAAMRKKYGDMRVSDMWAVIRGRTIFIARQYDAATEEWYYVIGRMIEDQDDERDAREFVGFCNVCGKGRKAATKHFCA